MVAVLQRYEVPRKREWWKVPPSTPYGRVLREKREERGWTQEQLADEVERILYPNGEGKFRQGMISNYELGKTAHPEPQIAQAIDLALGLEPGTLSDLAGYGRGGRRRVQQAPPPQGSLVIPPTDPKLIWLVEVIQEQVEEDEIEEVAQWVSVPREKRRAFLTSLEILDRATAEDEVDAAADEQAAEG